MTRYSVLDQSATSTGRSHAQTLRDTLDLAAHCERLGFYRFWVAEHHNSPANVGSAPEVLCAAIAALTRTIRVGSAGVLLSHYAPLKVAEAFRVLSAIAPGRIDLGIGRSPGGEVATVKALNRDVIPSEHEDAVRELLQWLGHDGMGTATAAVSAFPTEVDGPQPWMLGSSLRGARLAASFGLPFCFNFSHGQNYGLAADALSAYRSGYRPSREFPQPIASGSIFTIAAETAEEAEHLFAPRIYWRAMLDRGQRGPMVAPEVAATLSLTSAEHARIEAMRAYSLVGAVDDIAARLEFMAEANGLDEIVLATWTFDPQDRAKSLALLAEALL
jgi:luciferase family oxidoreductase group 1